MSNKEIEPEIVELARIIFRADQKYPGTIDVVKKISQSGLLDSPKDLKDLKTIIDIFGKRR